MLALGADGSLFVDPLTVITALGGRWDAVTSDAGWGSWSVLRRT